MITIERDKYGNILRHLTQNSEYIREVIYQYNHKGDMISREAYDKDKVLLDKNIIHNEYDNKGNLSYQKDIFCLYDIVSKDIISSHVTERVYDNIYDMNGLLMEVTNSYLSPITDDESYLTTNQMEKIRCYKEKYYYNNALLEKKEHFNYSCGIPIAISSFKYDDHGRIMEEEVYLDEDVLSHCVTYKHIEENRYWKTIVGPSRRNHSWMIDELIDTRCCVILYETCCTVQLIEDVLTYVLKTYEGVKDITISLNTAEDTTTYKSVYEIISKYQDDYNLWIAIIP